MTMEDGKQAITATSERFAQKLEKDTRHMQRMLDFNTIIGRTTPKLTTFQPIDDLLHNYLWS